MFLTADQIYQLTGKKRFNAQRKVLLTNGIHHTIRGDGSPCILISVLENPFSDAHNKKTLEPNWSFIHAEQKYT